MRYGLLALSVAMLAGGGVAAQSALDISYSAQAIVAHETAGRTDFGGGYGSLPYTEARNRDISLGAR